MYLIFNVLQYEKYLFYIKDTHVLKVKVQVNAVNTKRLLFLSIYTPLKMEPC